MKKYVIFVLLMSLLLLTLSACGGGENTVATSGESRINDDSSNNEDDAGSQSPQPFKEIAGKTFYFCSGAGGWDTHIVIEEDGSFTGDYHDTNMGETGDGYPHGTTYKCIFSGKFTVTEQKDDRTFVMKLDYLTVEGPTEESISDGVKTIPASPYGIEGGSTFMLYLPGLPGDSLPEEFLRWVQMPNGWMYDDSPLVFPYYGIYNVEKQEGFFCGDLSARTADVSALSDDERYAVNLFLSNFSEQGAFEKNGFDTDNYSLDELAHFAFIYHKINQSGKYLDSETIGSVGYYKIERDVINGILDRYVGINITDEQASRQLSVVQMNDVSDASVYYMNDRFYFVGATGRRYLEFTVVNAVQKLDKGKLLLHFTIYRPSTNGRYFGDKVDDSLYRLTPEQAARDEDLEKVKNGIAVIAPYEYEDTQTYRLINYVAN